VALLLRLPLLGLPPTLSDDLLRYAWDGRVIASGANPWRLAPTAAELAPLRDDLWRRLPHREVPTVYPPLALGAFSIAGSLPDGARLPALKTILVAADLGTCALLLALARRRGLPAARAAWYAWSPVVALEVAGMGHVDALGAAAAVGAVLLLAPRRPAEGAGAASTPASESPASSGDDPDRPRAAESAAAAGASDPDRPVSASVPGRPCPARAVAAGAAAAAGILVKLAPAAALPMWARQSGRPGRFLAAAVGLAVLGLAPVAASVGGAPPGLVAYGVSWEHAGALFEPLWRLLDRAGAAPALAGWLERAEAATGWYEAWDGVYPLLYPQLLAKALLAAAAAVLVARSLREVDPVAGSRRLFGGLLVVSATFYPWYLLWVLPFAALGRSAPWLLLAATSPLLYLPQLRDVGLFPGVWLAVWGPPAALAAALAVARRRR